MPRSAHVRLAKTTNVQLSKIFFEYRTPNEKEFKKLNQQSIIVLDTNVLLDLYRLPVNNAVKILAAIDKLKERIWVPHQVAEEFSRDRRIVIENQKKDYERFISSLKQWLGTDFDGEKNKTGKYKLESTWGVKSYHHPFLDIGTYINRIEKYFNRVIKEVEKLNKQHIDRQKNDEIFAKLDKLFKGKIGAGLPKEQLDNENGVYGNGPSSGEARYSFEIPPGFADAKEKDKTDPTHKQKFGDLIIWYELIEKARVAKKSVVFITGEGKKDWWWENHGAKFGPHYMLQREFYEKTNGMNFYIYRTDEFLSKLELFGASKIDAAIINEARRIIELNEIAKAIDATRVGISSQQKINSAKTPISSSSQNDQEIIGIPEVGEVKQ